MRLGFCRHRHRCRRHRRRVDGGLLRPLGRGRTQCVPDRRPFLGGGRRVGLLCRGLARSVDGGRMVTFGLFSGLPGLVLFAALFLGLGPLPLPQRLLFGHLGVPAPPVSLDALITAVLGLLSGALAVGLGLGLPLGALGLSLGLATGLGLGPVLTLLPPSLLLGFGGPGSLSFPLFRNMLLPLLGSEPLCLLGLDRGQPGQLGLALSRGLPALFVLALGPAGRLAFGLGGLAAEILSNLLQFARFPPLLCLLLLPRQLLGLLLLDLRHLLLAVRAVLVPGRRRGDAVQSALKPVSLGRSRRTGGVLQYAIEGGRGHPVNQLVKRAQFSGLGCGGGRPVVHRENFGARSAHDVWRHHSALLLLGIHRTLDLADASDQVVQ
mmetsp:Transcript_31443/g.94492  ORF Transcript_31443/g.94492 Transcript_31443/m.94492 type:complete len:379 (+) Transcript_31443:1324-2460(+)